MKAVVRLLAVAALVAILACVAWTTIQATRVDELARTNPEAALLLDPDHPGALLQMARRQLRDNRPDAAMATARHVLAVAPGQGDAFAVLALAAARRGDANAGKLAEIALQRAPRNRDLRTVEAAAALKRGELQRALTQIDALLRLSPGRGTALLPAMAQQAADPAFADALVAVLAASPPWRASFLGVLGSAGTPVAVDHVYARLQRRGELTTTETGSWLDRMIADGRWGEAYAHWVGTLGRVDGSLAAVHDGGFDNDPSGVGFDWRNQPMAGVFTDLEAVPGAGGNKAAHLHFINRPAAGGNLRQALLLGRGHFRLALRARAEFLHSDQGLQWIVRCDKGPAIATLEMPEGSFDWRALGTQFEVPDGCPGQWLELVNPAVTGSAQQVGGDLWIDDVSITPLVAASGS